MHIALLLLSLLLLVPGVAAAPPLIAENDVQLAVRTETDDAAVVIASRRLSFVTLIRRRGSAIVLKCSQLDQIAIKCQS